MKLMGGFNFVADARRSRDIARGYLSPGHNSAYYDATTKQHLLITHTRFPNRGEEHSIRVHELFVNAGRLAGGLAASLCADPGQEPGRRHAIMLGDYKLINLGKDINRAAKQSVYVSLNADLHRSPARSPANTVATSAEPGSRHHLTRMASAEPFEGRLCGGSGTKRPAELAPVSTAVSGKGVSHLGSTLGHKRNATRCWPTLLRALAVPNIARRQFAGAADARCAWDATSSGVPANEASSRPTAP